jgi:predicted oxidoreductase
VVVVGGGEAGMSAALEASSGARVVLLEGQDALGGSALVAQAVTALPGPDGLAAWDARAGSPNARRTRYAQRVEPDVIRWTEQLGAVWGEVPDLFGLGLELRSPQGGGQQLVTILEGALTAAKVDVRMGQRVSSVERGERWRVTAHGSEPIEADAVILATGGFMANTALARSLLGEDAGIVLAGAPRHADGNGMTLARKAGGSLADPLTGLLYGHAVAHPKYPTRALMILGPGGGWTLDSEGHAQPGLLDDVDEAAKRIWALPGRRAWVVYDGAKADKLWLWDVADNKNLPAAQVAERTKLRHDDLPSLAAAMRVPLASLEAGTEAQGGPLTGASGYAAFTLNVAAAKATSGVLTDLEGRVLGPDGAPIPGLYAAGELTGFGNPYGEAVLDSTMVAGAVLTGRDAAKAALADAAP